MSKRYLIAGAVTEIAYKFPYTAKMLENYEYFGNKPTDLSIIISVDEFLAEAENLKGESDDFIENSAILRKLSNTLLLEWNAIFFHGSAVSYNDNAFIFTAPSGTGKSTHTAILKKILGDKIKYINDDKPILKCDESGKIIVYGSPWNGKHGLGENISAPLKAVCLVTRAEQNSICEVSPVDFMKVLLEQSVGFNNEKTAGKVLDILTTLMQNYKFYILKCNMDISAGKISFEGMMYED